MSEYDVEPDWDVEGDPEVDDDATEDDQLPCPACGAMVYDDTDRCPHCGDWIMPLAAAAGRKSRLWIAVVVLMIIALLTWIVL
ncbi:MAG: hypothetical protein GY778_13335 [bacterium]|nr:hypothetical protein [bacterium]